MQRALPASPPVACMVIDLPMPPRKLNPNGKTGRHWGSTAPSTKKARQEAEIVARATANYLGFRVPPGKGPIPVHLLFLCNTRRNRDKDNSQASCKAMLDGIADGLGVNDTRFDVRSDFDPDLHPLPTVRVTITI